MKKPMRTTKGLRDVLFDEIEQLRTGEGDAQRAMAVANLAKQIINIAKVELDFVRAAQRHHEAGVNLELGNMQLGSASPAGPSGTESKSAKTGESTASTLS